MEQPVYNIPIKKKKTVKKQKSPKLEPSSLRLPEASRLNEKFIDILGQLETILSKQGEPFKSRAYHNAQETIMVLTEDLTVENYKTVLKGKPGIGSTIIEKLQEFVETGTLRLLEREKTNPLNVLTDVYGIGPKKAKDLIISGIISIPALREKQNDVLNDIQKVGLKYYEDILERIPRSEIDEFGGVFRSVFQEVVKGKPESEKNAFEIVGSYRRGALQSGDIDVIITGKTGTNFKEFIDKLKETGIILEILSRGLTKCLVVGKLLSPSGKKARRIDFLFTTPEEYPFSVLYFTGSKIFNTVMRGHALTMGYSLNEHGLHKMNKTVKGEKVSHVFLDERSIFDFLNMEYKSPEQRIDGRSVVIKGKEKNGSPVLENTTISLLLKQPEPSVLPHPVDPVISNEKKSPKRVTIRRKKEPTAKAEKKKEEPIVLEKLKEEGKEIKEEIKEPKKKRTYKKREPGMQKTQSKKNPCLKNEVILDSKTISLEHFKTHGVSSLEALTEDALGSMVKTASYNYYNLEPGQTTILTDNEYDVLKEFIERKFPNNTAIQEIGAPIEKNKVTLPYNMPSMNKIKPDTGVLEGWSKKYTGPYILSCKLDGVSGMYSTESSGEKLYTRGNGKVGQDISHLIKFLKLPKMKDIVVRGEFIMPKKVFLDKYQTKFANPRNLVAGIVNSISTDEKTKDLHFVAYEVIKPVLNPSEQMAFLKKSGFEVVQNAEESTLTNKKLSDVLVDWRSNYLYEIDGVIVTNDALYPRITGNPDHSFAFKMVLSDQMAEVKVVDVIWNASKDGYLKPRIQLEPVRLSGVTIEFATGFNAAFIENNKIGIGAIVKLIRSGDVIPYIKEVVVPATVPKMPTVEYKWNETHVDVILENLENSSSVLEKNITGFFRGIEVDGLSVGNVSKLVKAGFDSIPKIIAMSKDDFLTVDGFKEKTAAKLHSGIKDRLAAVSIGTIMSASNLFGRGFSDKKIDLVLAEVGMGILTSTESVADKKKRIAAIKGMAVKTADLFVESIPRFLAFLDECGLRGKLIPSASAKKADEKDESHPLYKKSIVMTGSRDKILEKKLVEIGAVIGSSVSKNTFAVITDDLESDSSKVQNAKKLGVPLFIVQGFKDKYFV
jgi:NAD-dependent DNA ligase/DNA polymerase/3'-5' exonuclease PolX